ncbi:MAG: WG repeat-containing protein [Deltaproteobacteria bacterium]|nr:WG repeat-containing protein [Deltaproteobacteria bacterium]
MKIVSIILLLFAAAPPLRAADCEYVARQAKKGPTFEMTSHKDCGIVTDGDELKLKKTHFNRLDFSDNGLAWVWIDKKIFLVAKNGKSARMHIFDNGPDYFEEGLARMIRNGKFGFVNKRLTVVIEPAYDFAFQFTDGYATVCNECKTKWHGEHSTLVGGAWGIIDRKGDVVVPVTFAQGTLPDPAEYKKMKKNAGPEGPAAKSGGVAPPASPSPGPGKASGNAPAKEKSK